MTPGGKCFTFVWKLKNASYCIQKPGEEILSPAFVVDAIESTKWRLVFYPRRYGYGNPHGFMEPIITYNLRREKDSSGNDKVDIKFDLNLTLIDGGQLTDNRVYNGIFSKGEESVVPRTIPSRDASFFLPNDTLTLRCRMWKSEGEMTEDVKCTAITRIGVEKITLKWEVKNFNSLELEKKLNLHIKSVQNDSLLMTVDLALTGDINSEIIQFELSRRDYTIKFVSLRLFLINNSGNKVKCNHQNIWFDNPTSSEQLTFTFTKKELLERKDVYLPNDTLSLIWEWGFSKGIVSEEPEEDEHGCICGGNNIPDVLDMGDIQKSLLNDFVNDAKRLYDERFLSDVKLETKTSDFLAHKFVLSMSSSVFKAMFSCDMKENITDCVHIEDLDDETVDRMLLFMYSTRVKELTWKSAINLYEAADKYDIRNLKKICSSFLKKNLSLTNACDVLLIADSHADAELKSDVQDYILENGKQITKSEEWKALMEANLKLAAETLSQLFK